MDGSLTINEILNWLKDNFGWVVTLLSLTIEIVPVKFKPISWLAGIIFKPIRSEMAQIRQELSDKIDKVNSDLKAEIDSVKAENCNDKKNINELLKAFEMSEISRIRWSIIEFANSIENGQLHTRDEYRHIKDDNKRYHALIEKYDLENGVIDEEMIKINNHYEDNKDSTSVFF